MIVFFILLISTLPLFLILHYTYASIANKNSQNLFMLVYVPAEHQNSPTLQAILQSYKKSLKKMSLLLSGLFIAFHIVFLVPVLQQYIGILVMVWLFLFLLPLYLYSALAQNYRQKVIALKAAENWMTPKPQSKVYADLKLSRLKNLHTPKTYLFVIPLILSLASYFWFSKSTGNVVAMLFLISSTIIHLMCLALHLLVSHAPAKIYNNDHETNLLLNQNYRRNWSLSYLVLSFSQGIFYWVANLLHLRFLNDFDFNGMMSYIGILVLTAVLPIVLFLYAYMQNKHKEKELLGGNEQISHLSEVDHHYIWDGIWGFRYDNPDNPAVLVNKPIGIGQTLNTGIPKGKFWYRFTKIFAAIILIGSFLILGFEEVFFPIMQVSENGVQISRSLYPYQIGAEQIDNIELVDEVYTGSPFKNIGTASNRMLRGTFSAKGEGNTRFYLFRLQKPYLKFTLNGADSKALYFNYENPEDTLALWQRIQISLPSKTTDYKESISGQSRDNISREQIISSEIDYSVPAGKGTLKAVLNMPKKAETAPLVLFIGGSGPSTKEGIAGLNLDFASVLLSNNIAVLRYDERGIAGSSTVIDAQSEEHLMTIEMAVEDVVLLLKKAKQDNRFSDIIVAGHSEGALIGTLAAQKVEIDGLISLAGSGRPIDEIIMEQLRANPNNPQTILDESQAILKSLKNGQTVKEVPRYLQALFRPSVQPYMISWIKYDPAEELAKIKKPILILQGDNDMQVSTLDAQKLQQATGSKAVILEHMTHMLKDSSIAFTDVYKSRKNMTEYSAVYQNENLPINDRLLTEMINFILNLS